MTYVGASYRYFVYCRVGVILIASCARAQLRLLYVPTAAARVCICALNYVIALYYAHNYATAVTTAEVCRLNSPR